jgi:hypothetical protein
VFECVGDGKRIVGHLHMSQKFRLPWTERSDILCKCACDRAMKLKDITLVVDFPTSRFGWQC